MRKPLIVFLLFVSQAAWSQAVKPADVEKNIAEYEKIGRSKVKFATEISNNPNVIYRNCVSALDQLRLVTQAHQLRTPKNTKMLVHYSYLPPSGLYVYQDDRIFHMDMGAEIQKFKRCKLAEDQYAFDMDFGNGEVVHMEGNYLGFSQVPNPPSKKQVPFPCKARMHEVTNSEDAKGRLEAFVVSQVKNAAENFQTHTAELAKRKKAYREAAPRPNPFGNTADAAWMDHVYGQPIVESARLSDASMFQAALDHCAAVPSPVVKEQVGQIVADLKLNGKTAVTNSGTGAAR